ncbi:MAG: hypothetical protein P8Y71_24390 [Pseudolabrys sp.]
MTIITFPQKYNLDERSIKLVQGMVGIYFIWLEKLRISYPFRESRLIYIGMSESRQNSIGRRLRAHLTGQSGNFGIRNYAARHEVRFTYHSFQLLRNLGLTDLYEIESFFLSDFLRVHGAFPICNNQSGVNIIEGTAPEAVEIAWEEFAH